MNSRPNPSGTSVANNPVTSITGAPSAPSATASKARITVRSASIDTDRVNAGGLAYAARDSIGCVTLQPYPVYPGYVIENPPDTAQYWSGFVRGYLYKPAAAVCGATTVFHLVSRN